MNSSQNTANRGFLLLVTALPGKYGALAVEQMQERSPTGATGCIFVGRREGKMEILGEFVGQ
jgi:hypothetical protein